MNESITETNADTTCYMTKPDGETVLHASADCGGLLQGDAVHETTYGEEPDDRRRCQFCHDGPTAAYQGVPRGVPCPCGEGAAERAKTPTTTTAGVGVERHFHYKHEGCPLGGTIVTRNGHVERLTGPVFEPERFGVTAADAAGGVAD